MKTRASWLVAFVLALGAPAFGQITDEASVPRISLAGLTQAIDARQVLIVDVRDASSYADGHIPGAILLPLAEVQRRAPGLKGAKKPIVAYCA